VRERNFLQSIGISVDCAQDNKTAYELLRLQGINGTPYDLVISDYDRDNEPGETGFTLLKGMREQGYRQEVVYFTASGQKKPDNAFALTNYSGDLLNYVFDALERANTAKSDSVALVDENSYSHLTARNSIRVARKPSGTQQ
jgi:DNA-binding response OmpR family regulator